VRVTVKLGSALREKAPDWAGGEGIVELADGGEARVRDVMHALGISDEEVNIIYRNHRLVTPNAHVEDGDRVALFPPNFIHFSQFYLRRSDE
jgi:molybdopterin converting factor small subunit